MSLKDLKVNVPKVALGDYFWLIAGIPKAGKTSLFANLVQKMYGDINKGLLLAWEKGYSALRVVPKDIPDWETWEEVVEELVEEKDNLPFELLGIDTGDVMWDKAIEKVIRDWNRENPSKRTKDISGVGAKKAGGQGYGEGYNRAKKLIRDSIDKLQKAGYGIMVITHSKDKEIEQKDGLKYDQLVVSLPTSAREVFVNLADFIVFVTIEKQKDENDNLITQRYMYFRSDGYVEAGGRFQNVPERIEYDIDGFIEVFENAVKAEFDEGTDLKAVAKEQQKEKEEEIKKNKEQLQQQKEAEEAEKANETLETIIAKIDEKVNALSNDEKVEIAKEFKEILGTPNYKKATDVDLLKECLAKVALVA